MKVDDVLDLFQLFFLTFIIALFFAMAIFTFILGDYEVRVSAAWLLFIGGSLFGYIKFSVRANTKGLPCMAETKSPAHIPWTPKYSTHTSLDAYSLTPRREAIHARRFKTIRRGDI